MNAEIFFDLSHTILKEYFKSNLQFYKILRSLSDIINELSRKLDDDYIKYDNNIFIHKSAVVHSSATILGPCIIDKDTTVRPNAFIRENVIIGKGVVIGNCTELKGSIIFDGAKCPHFNYVGDSILGYMSHLGAGVIISNQRLDKKEILVSILGERIGSGTNKLGAIVGDFAEIGSNTVINPGSVIHRSAVIYPISCVNGEIKGIYKSKAV